MTPSASVFAIEDTAVQVHWRGVGSRPVRAEVYDDRGRTVGSCVVEADDVDAAGGAGAAACEGLSPATAYRIEVRAGDEVVAWLDATTLTPPPGALLGRVASISDLHLGELRFGLFPRVGESPRPAVPHPRRAALAAVAELEAWGAQRLVAKGDLTDHARPDEFAELDEVLTAVSIPVEVMLGNHEVQRKRGHTEPRTALASLGHDDLAPVRTIDVEGLRLVLVDTTRDGRSAGHVHPVHDAAVQAVADAEHSALVVLHHHLHRWPVPTTFPLGVPAGQGHALLRDLARANPAVLVTSGHSHRHRRRSVAGLTVTEVGSTKDYPGVWAGYAIHEGGLRQAVRRVGEPSVVRFTEATRAVMFGLWRWWTPGRLSDRCFSLAWPAPRRG
jgi:predicted phosphodiesterase